MDPNKRAKRVSFADTKSIREFLSSGENVSQWQSSYAATVSSSSDSSGAVTLLETSTESFINARTQAKPTAALQDHTTDANLEGEEHTTGESNFLARFLQQGSQAGEVSVSSFHDQDSNDKQCAEELPTSSDIQKQKTGAIETYNAEHSNQVENRPRFEITALGSDEHEECLMELTCGVLPVTTSTFTNGQNLQIFPDCNDSDQMEFTCQGLPVKSDENFSNFDSGVGAPANRACSNEEEISLESIRKLEDSPENEFLNGFLNKNSVSTTPVASVFEMRSEAEKLTEVTSVSECNMELTYPLPSRKFNVPMLPEPVNGTHGECDMEFTNLVLPLCETQRECDLEISNVSSNSNFLGQREAEHAGIVQSCKTLGECDMELTNVVNPQNIITNGDLQATSAAKALNETRGECDMEITNVVPVPCDTSICDMEFTDNVYSKFDTTKQNLELTNLAQKDSESSRSDELTCSTQSKHKSDRWNADGSHNLSKELLKSSGSSFERVKVCKTLRNFNSAPNENTSCGAFSIHSPVKIDSGFTLGSYQLGVSNDTAITGSSHKVLSVSSSELFSSNANKDGSASSDSSRQKATNSAFDIDENLYSSSKTSEKTIRIDRNEKLANSQSVDTSNLRENEANESDGNSSLDFISNVSVALVNSDDSFQSPEFNKLRSVNFSESNDVPHSKMPSNLKKDESKNLPSEPANIQGENMFHDNIHLKNLTGLDPSGRSQNAKVVSSGVAGYSSSIEPARDKSDLYDVEVTGKSHTPKEFPANLSYNRKDHSDEKVLGLGEHVRISSTKPADEESHQGMGLEEKSAPGAHCSMDSFEKSPLGSPEPIICSDCHSEKSIFNNRDKENVMILQCMDEEALLKCGMLQMLLSLQSCSDGHKIIKNAHWLLKSSNVKHPLARYALSVFRENLEQSSGTLCKRRVCCLGEALYPVRVAAAAATDLLLELHQISMQFVLKPQKDGSLVVRALGKNALVELRFIFKTRCADTAGLYGLISSAHSVVGCVRASKLEDVMREVEVGPLLLTRTVVAAAALLD